MAGASREVRALRARAHPIRLRMLSLLTGAAMSAAELAREIGLSQALASYHLRALIDADLVELAEEFTHRGGRERRYRYRVDVAERPEAGSRDEDRRPMIAALVTELQRRESARDPHQPGLVVDAELWVTDEEWQAIHEAVKAAGVRLHERAARPGTPNTRPVNASIVMFAMTDPRAKAGRRVRR